MRIFSQAVHYYPATQLAIISIISIIMDLDWELHAQLLGQPMGFDESGGSSGTHLAQGAGVEVQLGSLIQTAGKFSRSAPSSAGLGVWWFDLIN